MAGKGRGADERIGGGGRVPAASVEQFGVRSRSHEQDNSPNYILDAPVSDSVKQSGQAGNEYEIKITPEIIEAGAVAALEYQEGMSIFEARYLAKAILMSAISERDTQTKTQPGRR